MSSMPPPLEIARAGGDDLDAVMTVIERAFDARFGEAWTRAQCAGILPMSGVTLLVAREGRDTLGFSLARRVADEAELLLIGVLPQARGRGIATALLDRFIAEHRAFGVRTLHLEVRDGNPAVGIYTKRNFAVRGRRANYYRGRDGEKFDAMTMVLDV